VNELEDEFHLHQKYSHNIRRLQQKKKIPRYGGKHGQLPPLEGEDEEEEEGGDVVSASASFKNNKKADMKAVSQSLVIQSSKSLTEQDESEKPFQGEEKGEQEAVDANLKLDQLS